MDKTETQKLTTSDGATTDRFGVAVVISDDGGSVVIDAPILTAWG